MANMLPYLICCYGEYVTITNVNEYAIITLFYDSCYAFGDRELSCRSENMSSGQIFVRTHVSL